MEILINELSLNGQFSSVDCFIETGLMPFVSALNDIELQSNVLYTTYEFYRSKVTSNNTIHDILNGETSRQYDVIRRFKSQLMKLLNDPRYWEDDPKHTTASTYSYRGNNICGSSLAEASERDKIIISFFHNDFIHTQLSVFKDKSEIRIDNIFEHGHFTQTAYQRNQMPFDVYCYKTFSNTKLSFSEIDIRNGFSLVRKDEESLFYKGFRKFVDLSWQQISVDDALDYKEYNNKNYFKNIGEKIYKFRISQKYRCFGYVKNSTFFVLQFDLEHKLSDVG
jgi:hypothetical protein